MEEHSNSETCFGLLSKHCRLKKSLATCVANELLSVCKTTLININICWKSKGCLQLRLHSHLPSKELNNFMKLSHPSETRECAPRPSLPSEDNLLTSLENFARYLQRAHGFASGSSEKQVGWFLPPIQSPHPRGWSRCHGHTQNPPTLHSSFCSF